MLLSLQCSPLDIHAVLISSRQHQTGWRSSAFSMECKQIIEFKDRNSSNSPAPLCATCANWSLLTVSVNWKGIRLADDIFNQSKFFQENWLGIESKLADVQPLKWKRPPNSHPAIPCQSVTIETHVNNKGCIGC